MSRTYRFGQGQIAPSVATERHGEVSPKYALRDGRPGVMACHSSTGTAFTTCATAPDWVPHMARLGEYFHVVAGDLKNPQNWGSDPTQDRVDDKYDYLQANFNVAAEVFLFALSMGGLASLNWAIANPTLVAAIALMIPIVDLQDAHDNRGFAALIDGAQAYGSHAAYVAALPDKDPSATGRQAALAGIPIKVWTGGADPAAVPSIVQAWADSVNAVGGDVEVVSMGPAVGHTTVSVDSEEVAEFLLGHV